MKESRGEGKQELRRSLSKDDWTAAEVLHNVIDLTSETTS